jgi:hypothetical protein
MIDHMTPRGRLRVLERRGGSRVLLWLVAILLVLLFVVFLPSRDAQGAQVGHVHGVRPDGAMFNCWRLQGSPLREFCVFYPIMSLARR